MNSFSKWFFRLFFVLLGITLAFTVLRGIHNYFNSSGNKVDSYKVVKCEYDQNLGYRLTAGQIAEVDLIEKAKYKYNYSTDKYGRRITPVNDPEKRDTAFLFFADSLMFGEGVNDNETLPFFLSGMIPYCMPYNYGCPGYGPQQMLAKLQDAHIVNEISKSRKYACVYLFIDSHVNRAIGSMSLVSSYGKDMPYYFLNDKGILTRNGSFASGRPVLTFIYRMVGLNKFDTLILNDLSIHDIPVINDGHIKLTCKIIEESREEFKKRFGSEEFFVVLWPGACYASKMIPYFKKSGVKYFDYSSYNTISKEGYAFPDGHPTKLAYQTRAPIISQDIDRSIKSK